MDILLTIIMFELEYPKPDPNEPMVVRPHHMERIARAIMFDCKFREIKEQDLEDYDTLIWLLNENPEAEVMFVDDISEPNCQFCIKLNGNIPPCREEYATEEEPRGELYVSKFDREVAEAQGWEFNKPYKIAKIIELFTKQAAFRTIFYMNELDEELYEMWREDARRIKESRLLKLDFERPTPETIDMEQLKQLMRAFTEETFVRIPDKPDFTVDVDFEDNMNKARKLIKAGKFYTANHEGEMVGFGGLDHYGHIPGEPFSKVYELTQVYTDPSMRRQKMFTRLVKQMMADFEAEEPESVMISASEKKPVLDLLYAEGFEDFDADTMFAIYDTNPEHSDEDREHEKAWTDSKKGHPTFRFVMQGRN